MSEAIWSLINVLQSLFTVAWSIVWISLALCVRLLTGSAEPALWMARRIWAPGLLWGARARLEIEGLERLDSEGPYFFVVNHQSQIDIPTVFMALPMNLRFIVKEELQGVPFLGWYISAMGMVYVNRRARLQALCNARRAAAVIAGGRSLAAFPEGGRSRDGRIGQFKTGALLPAIEAGVPVVPVAVHGAGEVLPAGAFRVRPGLISVAIGEPIDTADLEPADRRMLAARSRERVVAMRERLEARARRAAQPAGVGAEAEVG